MYGGSTPLVIPIKYIPTGKETWMFITTTQNKPAYHKMITPDRIVNVTGETGSGKSSLCQIEFGDNERYLVIDTDKIFDSSPTSPEIESLREVFKNKTKDMLMNDFDLFYKTLLAHFKNEKRILIIDSAQYRNIKDVSLLKGDIIIMRTCVDTCFQRCVDRYTQKNPHATEEEKRLYAQKKMGMYQWYHSLNKLIERVDNI